MTMTVGKGAESVKHGLANWSEAGNFAIFVLPALAIFTAIVFVPIVWTLIIGFTNERATRLTTSFVGFDNFAFLLSDASFWKVLGNTVIITLLVVTVTNALGVAIALLLRKSGWLYRALRSIYFTPVILSSVVVAVIWRSLLVDNGLVNSVLRSWGIATPPGWLSDPSVALFTVTGVVIWQSLGFAVVVYLAGLAGIPAELEEAASLDGAGPIARFRHLTWPLLAPALTITTVMLMISSFKLYDQIAVLTNGGPGVDGTTSIAFDVIQTAFVEQRAGIASATAGIMLLVVAVASALTLRALQRREVDF
jgi:multiple sugar transport system permease protein